MRVRGTRVRVARPGGRPIRLSPSGCIPQRAHGLRARTKAPQSPTTPVRTPARRCAPHRGQGGAPHEPPGRTRRTSHPYQGSPTPHDARARTPARRCSPHCGQGRAPHEPPGRTCCTTRRTIEGPGPSQPLFGRTSARRQESRGRHGESIESSLTRGGAAAQAILATNGRTNPAEVPGGPGGRVFARRVRAAVWRLYSTTVLRSG